MSGFDMEKAQEFAQLEGRKKELEGELKQVKERLQELESELLEQFEEAGVDSIKVAGRTIYLQRDIQISPIEGDMLSACRKLQESGFDDYVKEQFNYQQMKTLVKNFEKEEGEVPEALQEALNIHEIFRLRSRKA